MREYYQPPRRAILNFGKPQRVVHTSVDRALRGAKAFLKKGIWSKRAQFRGLRIDLSKVTWCEVGACARLVLLVERALRDGLPVEVALPNPKALGNELFYLERAECELRIERRRNALRFLDRIGFRQAIACPHLELANEQFRFITRYDRRDDKAEYERMGMRDSSADLAKEQRRLRQIVHAAPLRWISTRNPDLDSLRQALEGVRQAVSQLAGKTVPRPPGFDPAAFTETVLRELFDNARLHATADHCLVGIWAQQGGRDFIDDEYPECERSFFRDWVDANGWPVIDITCGDSGPGLHEVLRDAFEAAPPPYRGVPEELANKAEAIVLWALAGGTSSGEGEAGREDHGLQRVRRLVQEHQGQLSLRTGTVLAGWSQGGVDRHGPIAQRALPPMPGTVVSTRFAG